MGKVLLKKHPFKNLTVKIKMNLKHKMFLNLKEQKMFTNKNCCKLEVEIAPK